MANHLQSITIYAGSADNLPEEHLHAAYELGKIMAREKRVLIFGSGKTGLMGAVARGSLEHNGQVVGVINDDLNLPHLVFSELTRIEKVANIQLRQARMSELGDGFIALPGGFGTLYEVLEALTWAQLGQHHKPVGFLNIGGYYDPLFSMFDHAIACNYIYPEHRGLFVQSGDPVELLALMDAFIPPQNMNRWLTRDE
ncbi:MAG: TIGR00730 family Rossman fold protein [Anaerolineaceae bacterium]|jgi:hypothetical protein|nr:TIGR00730 family Rossman fold protein [Anaerolineaceae bacterium]MDD4042809.1 TIGR00730 family Rossman fold protein [Anaerolineaceae bacterium]MDD4577499.1 TIGR00730 family Rossman fold protein [Anaerolineaceae bacterium]